MNKLYNAMWAEFCTAILQNSPQIDSNLDTNINNPIDTRRGITALAYLHKNNNRLVQEISSFKEQIRQIEPDQYYYPCEEIHLTILSIISCIEGFTLSDINIEKYRHVFNDVFAKQNPIEIEFRGITASPSCIVVQGFPSGNGLEILRDRLRDGFAKSGLHCSFDTRYKLVTAHTTVIRFRRLIQNRQILFTLSEKYREHYFGKVTLNRFELVFNDWYQRLANTTPLSQFNITS